MGAHVLYDKVGLVGDTSGIAAASGMVGEFLTTPASPATVGGAFSSGQFGNINSLALTQGNWRITAQVTTGVLTLVTAMSLALSENSGNTTTDHVEGQNQWTELVIVAAGGLQRVLEWDHIVGSAGATIFLKASMTGTLTNTLRGGIQARRME